MASTKRLKRVAAGQPGFISLKDSNTPKNSDGGRRKRMNKNKKKSWNKHSDIQDVEEFLEDVRLQERATGGLIAEKSDESLFFLDVGKKSIQKPAVPEEVSHGRKRKDKPLHIDLILQHDSLVSAPKDILSYQVPNARKVRRMAQRTEQLAARGKVTRRQRRLLAVRPVAKTTAKPLPGKLAVTKAGTEVDRNFYDLWGAEAVQTADPWYMEQTGRTRVKRPEKLNEKPSLLPAVEVIAPGGSYNPEFLSHQALLQEAHDVEVKKVKEEERIARQLAVNREDYATQETVFEEQVQGLMEEEEDEEEHWSEEDCDPVGGVSLMDKKTEKQRRKERESKVKEQQKQALRVQSDRRQQLFQLRSIHSSLRKREQTTRLRQARRKAKQEAQKSQPRRLGKLKFQPQDLEVQLSNELAGSLRRLKPEGSVLKDRFKSLQKRNLIEPRERAKFKRKHKLKYTEKRAFREITA
ncbi:ribosome biogenesis protein NOP53 [Aplochiton taeniatus]